jgi:hypothetical protein
MKSERALDVQRNYISGIGSTDDENELLRAINLQRYACLIYGLPRCLPKLGQKVAIVV